METGEIPEDWITGLIEPIYKQKGGIKDSNNYRGITLLSCLGKLFTCTINTRLIKFCEDNKILIRELQADFRGNYSTVDHIFLLEYIVELYYRIIEVKKYFVHL